MDPRCLLFAMLSVLFLAYLAPVYCEGQTIRILSIGAVLAGDSPIVKILAPEPAVQQTLVPTRHASEMDPETARRYVRLYFPKTHDRLKDYDFILYVAAPDVRPLTTSQISQLRRVTEDGTPALADQGGISSYEPFRDAWIASSLHEMFPNDAASVLSHGVAHSLGASNFRVSVKRDSYLPPVLTPFTDLGIESIIVSHGWYVVPKQGSMIWAEMKGLFPGKGSQFPWLFSMKYVNGLTWNLGDNFVSSFWGSTYGECRNPYRTDILMNVIIYSIGRDLPEDVLVVHNQRKAFAEYLEQRRFLLELVEFADSFGANVAKLYLGVEEADSVRDEAKGSYLDQDYAKAQEHLVYAFELFSDLNKEAIKSKDRALLWVFASEWMVTTATLIIAGYILHLLMIKKYLYIETGSTSFKNG